LDGYTGLGARKRSAAAVGCLRIFRADDECERSIYRRADDSRGKIGGSAAWQPPKDFLANAHATCDKNSGAPADYGQCFIDQMTKAGAPADAVAFTRMLFQQSDGQVGILSAFKQLGRVDAAQVFYPLRANDNYGLLLVNGDPKVLDVDDLKKLIKQPCSRTRCFRRSDTSIPVRTYGRATAAAARPGRDCNRCPMATRNTS